MNELRIDNLRLIIDGCKGYFYEYNVQPTRKDYEELLNYAIELVDIIDQLRSSNKIVKGVKNE